MVLYSRKRGENCPRLPFFPPIFSLSSASFSLRSPPPIQTPEPSSRPFGPVSGERESSEIDRQGRPFLGREGLSARALVFGLGRKEGEERRGEAS